ncbi:MAG: glycosyltransferase family 9 protein [Alphaproteobacteria bacterium]|nr:glycosyltransferase family 9 protein [Alphaproteobacteria bacterium]
MRLLFITATRIGDAVLTTGLLDHFCRAHPGIGVTVACGAPAAPLFRSVPGLERVIVLDKRRWGLHWLWLWSQVVDKRWDIVVDLRRTILPQFLRKDRHHRAPKPVAERHRVVELAAAIGAAEPPAPRLWLSADDRAKAQALVDGAGLVLAVGPAANWRGKQWRAERFAALVARLTAPGGILPGARVAVFAGEGERDQAVPVLQSVPAERRIDLVGRVDLPVAAACLERCALFVGNDSGLMHLAAASGVPTLSLFGPSPDTRYAPWGPRTAVVRTRESYRELVEAPDFDHRTTGTLMDGLSVDMAAGAAEALWHRVLGVAA